MGNQIPGNYVGSMMGPFAGVVASLQRNRSGSGQMADQIGNNAINNYLRSNSSGSFTSPNEMPPLQLQSENGNNSNYQNFGNQFLADENGSNNNYQNFGAQTAVNENGSDSNYQNFGNQFLADENGNNNNYQNFGAQTAVNENGRGSNYQNFDSQFPVNENGSNSNYQNIYNTYTDNENKTDNNYQNSSNNVQLSSVNSQQALETLKANWNQMASTPNPYVFDSLRAGQSNTLTMPDLAKIADDNSDNSFSGQKIRAAAQYLVANPQIFNKMNANNNHYLGQDQLDAYMKENDY